MAGKRHHIIPRFLQRGFASRIEGDTVFTWLYMKKGGASKKEISTKDTIVSENFYGKKGSINADDEITEAEITKFSPLINKLRDGNCNFEEVKSEITELIAHLSIRTKVIRQGFQDTSGKMLDGIKEITTDEQVLEKVFLNLPKDVIEEQIGLVLSDPKYNELLKPAKQIFEMLGFQDNEIKNLISTLAINHLEDDKNKNRIKELLQNQLSEFFDKSLEILPDAIKKGHINSLSNHTIPENRAKALEKLEWNFFITNTPLILGDVACIFREIGEKQFKTNCDLDKMGQVYLPISSNQILIGTIENEEIEIDTKILNEAIARCSYEQFICGEKAYDKIDLIQLIGTNSYLVDDKEIEKGIGEIRENIENTHFKENQ